MLWRLGAVILTIRLALLAAPLEHVALVAVEVRPVSADPTPSAVPDDCPDVPAHSTL
jgi:hypothetical protein